MRVCPNCGNRSRRLIESNGERPSSPDLTLLCWLPLDQRPAECGMQWTPNDDDRDDVENVFAEEVL